MKTMKELETQKIKPKPEQDIFLNKKIVAPQKLKILVLSGNDIVNDQLEFIHRCVNLLKLDISNNHITKVLPKTKMGELTKLKILYLHNNRIENINGLEGIFYVPSLVHLTIKDNPIQKIPRIQHLIVNMLPTLKILGERVIFVQERSVDVFEARKNVQIEPQLAEGWKSKDNQQTHYINILELQLRYFENVWYFNNPIIRIQIFWKNKYDQLKIKRINNRKFKQSKEKLSFSHSEQINTLSYFFDEWREFTRKRKAVKQALTSQRKQDNKLYLTYSYDNYVLEKRNQKVNSIIKNCLDHARKQIFLRKMAERLRRRLKIKQIEFNGQDSFFAVCGIKKSQKFYFSKIQGHLIQNFLAHIGKNFNWREKIHNSIKLGSVTDYLSIRMVDPETFAVKKPTSTLTYMMWPSMKVVFLRKKKDQSTQKTGLIKIRPLCYIKNKNKNVSKQQFKKSCKVYRKLQKFYRKQYMNSLDYFSCSDEQVMKMLLRYIFYHNSKIMEFPKILQKNQMQSLLQNYDESLLIYAEAIVNRTAAAVRIQQNWRKYLVHKNQKDSIYSKMKATRAVYRIQRFWRDQTFYHRLSFHKSINYELQLFKGNSIMVLEQIYMALQQICEYEKKTLLYENLNIVLDRQLQKFKPLWEFQNSVIPQYIVRQFFPKNYIESSKYQEQNNTVKSYEILHYNSKVVKKRYNSNVYLQFQFNSVQQCRYRIYLLALLSYRIYGSLMYLPLSRETLQLENHRFSQYQNLYPFGKTKALKAKYSGLVNSYNKLQILKTFSQDGMFLFNIQERPKQSKRNFNITVEFYQKIYRDFPKKYKTTLEYILPDWVDEVQNRNLIQKQKIVKKLIQDNILHEQQEATINKSQIQFQTPHNQSNIGKTTHQRKQQASNNKDPFNVSKIDRKKLSLYEVGSKTGVNFREEKNTLTQARLFANTAEIRERKDNISRIRVQEQCKKNEIVEKKKVHISEIREKEKKQKDFTNNLRSIKQMERTQNMRKKVDRVKSFKSRLSSSKKKQVEQDFVQQGNFVMQQQLKMIIMKSKMDRISKNNKTKEQTPGMSRKHRSFMLNSQLSEQRSQIIQPQSQTNNQSIPIRLTDLHQNQSNYGGMIATLNDDAQRFQGGERKIVNVRQQNRKNRTQSIGAYLRDPSYVHGVFPQEYYPIQSKGATFKFFPPL